MNQKYLKENFPLLIAMALTAVLITVTGILFRQSFLRILPLYISLIVGLLQSRVNRYASLLGGINSILYALVYLHYHLYGSAIYAVLVSCPIQIITFVRWSKKPWGKSTVFRKMNWKQRVLTALGYASSLCLLLLILSFTDANYVVLDSAITLLGILNSLLMMFAFIEYTVLMIVGNVLNMSLYITMIQDTPEQITYLIYSVYSLICILLAFFRSKKFYREQQEKEMFK